MIEKNCNFTVDRDHGNKKKRNKGGLPAVADIVVKFNL